MTRLEPGTRVRVVLRDEDPTWNAETRHLLHGQHGTIEQLVPGYHHEANGTGVVLRDAYLVRFDTELRYPHSPARSHPASVLG